MHKKIIALSIFCTTLCLQAPRPCEQSVSRPSNQNSQRHSAPSRQKAFHQAVTNTEFTLTPHMKSGTTLTLLAAMMLIPTVAAQLPPQKYDEEFVAMAITKAYLAADVPRHYTDIGNHPSGCKDQPDCAPLGSGDGINHLIKLMHAKNTLAIEKTAREFIEFESERLARARRAYLIFRPYAIPIDVINKHLCMYGKELRAMQDRYIKTLLEIFKTKKSKK